MEESSMILTKEKIGSLFDKYFETGHPGDYGGFCEYLKNSIAAEFKERSRNRLVEWYNDNLAGKCITYCDDYFKLPLTFKEQVEGYRIVKRKQYVSISECTLSTKVLKIDYDDVWIISEEQYNQVVNTYNEIIKLTKNV